MQKLACPKSGVSALTFAPDGDLLAGLAPATLARNPRVACWARSRGWEPSEVEHHGPLAGVAFHPSGRTLAYAGISGSFWNPTPQPPPPRPATGIPPSVWRRRFAKETEREFTGVHFYPLTGVDEFVPNRAYVPWEAEGRPRPETWARGLCFTPDGRFLLAAHVMPVGGLGSRVGVFHWRIDESEGVWMLTEPTAARGDTADGAALVGGHLALAGDWGVAACPIGPPAGLIVPKVDAAKAVAAAPRGERVATTDGTTATVWSLRAADPLARVRTPHGAVSALAFAPDGRTLAVGHDGGVTAFVDAASGAVQAERDFGVGGVRALAYAPDGLTLAVAGWKGAVVVDTE